MKTLFLSSLLAFMPSLASAHVGHLGDLMGHDHVLGAAAIGAAIALGVWSSLKGKKSDDEEVSEIDAEEVQEA